MKKFLGGHSTSFRWFTGGRNPLLSQLPLGTIIYSGLFTHSLAAYAFLAGLTNATLQERNDLCANHAFFIFFAHFSYFTPPGQLAKRLVQNLDVRRIFDNQF